jgi:hypothetical protein
MKADLKSALTGRRVYPQPVVERTAVHHRQLSLNRLS